MTAEISAHQCNTTGAIRDALTGVELENGEVRTPDWVQVDVQATSDGEFLLWSEPEILLGDEKHEFTNTSSETVSKHRELLTLSDAAQMIHDGGSKIWASLHFNTTEDEDGPSCELDAVNTLINIVGLSNMMLSSEHESCVPVLRQAVSDGAMVGLQLDARFPPIIAERRIKEAQPDIVLAHYHAVDHLRAKAEKLDLPWGAYGVRNPDHMVSWICDTDALVVSTTKVKPALQISCEESDDN